MLFETINSTHGAGFGQRIGRRRRIVRRRAVAVCASVSIACGAGAIPALARPVPGATYNGRATDGAYVVFTVSADGREVRSYEIAGVIGDTCQFSGEGRPPSFRGAPITNNAFAYGFGGQSQSFSLAGTFPGAQSATGTLHFHNAALGAAKACDSGTVYWTATTTARPGAKPRYVTRVSLRRMARARLGGRITSRLARCARSRAVTLWFGRRRIHSTRSARNGTYWFARTASVRGRRVHVTVALRTVTAAVCRAASSKTVGA